MLCLCPNKTLFTTGSGLDLACEQQFDDPWSRGTALHFLKLWIHCLQIHCSVYVCVSAERELHFDPYPKSLQKSQKTLPNQCHTLLKSHTYKHTSKTEAVKSGKTGQGLKFLIINRLLLFAPGHLINEIKSSGQASTFFVFRAVINYLQISAALCWQCVTVSRHSRKVSIVEFRN